jgi:hypothetical protein
MVNGEREEGKKSWTISSAAFVRGMKQFTKTLVRITDGLAEN